jgi:lipoteichoic acid synthase
MSYLGETREAPALPLRTLSGELKAAGWATGFFYASDLLYDRAGEFLRAHDFDHVEDYRDRPGEPFTSEEFPFLDGSDDLATVRSLLEWTAARRAQPWLAVVWTNGTHYPYFVRGRVGSFPGVADPAFARHLTALKHGDEAFGTLMATLRERGQLDDTLVVVAGDHGEAFGQHGQLTHASHVYDENVHVPLLLVGPGLDARRQATIAGLVDIAPTVLHLAGLSSPAG